MGFHNVYSSFIHLSPSHGRATRSCPTPLRWLDSSVALQIAKAGASRGVGHLDDVRSLLARQVVVTAKQPHDSLGIALLVGLPVRRDGLGVAAMPVGADVIFHCIGVSLLVCDDLHLKVLR